MTFKDYNGKKVILSLDSWIHIKSEHSEITLRQIRLALAEPDEIRKSKFSSTDDEIYYLLISNKPKFRYVAIVVKNLITESYIKTALTCSRIKTGSLVYTRGIFI